MSTHFMPDGQLLFIPEAWTCFLYHGTLYVRSGAPLREGGPKRFIKRRMKAVA